MKQVPVAAFKDRVSEFVAQAQAGAEVIITRHGKPAAKLVPITPAPDAVRSARSLAIKALLRHRDSMRASGKTASPKELIDWKNEGHR